MKTTPPANRHAKTSPIAPHIQVQIIRDQTTVAVLPPAFRKIAIVIAGQASYTETGRTLQLKAGTLLTIPSGRKHEFIDRNQFECISIAYRQSLLTPYAGTLGTIPGYNILFRNDLAPRPVRGGTLQFQLDRHHLTAVTKLGWTIASTLSERKHGFEATATGLLLQLVATMIRACTTAGAGAVDHTRNTVATTITFLENNYAEPLTLTDLARRAHTSVNNLVRLFKRAIDMPPIEYLIHLRILKACEHLANPASQAKEIAFKVGFHDANYFARQFRQIMGMTPSQFRRHSARNPLTRQSPGRPRILNRAKRR